MNIVHEAISRACWQEENVTGYQEARPWLRWFLVRVLGMRPIRESSTKQRRRQQWLSIRKEAALKIDPETAEVFCEYGSIRDPYYVFEHGDDWEDCYGRNYFARSPGGVWVSFHAARDPARALLAGTDGASTWHLNGGSHDI